MFYKCHKMLNIISLYYWIFYNWYNCTPLDQQSLVSIPRKSIRSFLIVYQKM